jgi:hypothetical protein
MKVVAWYVSVVSDGQVCVPSLSHCSPMKRLLLYQTVAVPTNMATVERSKSSTYGIS